MRPSPFQLIILLAFCLSVVEGNERLQLSDFEDAGSLRLWGKPDNAQLVSERVTQGKQALKVTLSKGLVAGTWSRLPKDWSKYDHLRIDFHNPGKLVKLAVRFKDAKGKGYDLWNYEIPTGPHRAAFDLKKISSRINLSDMRQFWFHDSAKPTRPQSFTWTTSA